MTSTQIDEIAPLLGDLSDVPLDHIRDVSHTKRALESWTMDPDFRSAYEADPQAALDELGVALTPAQLNPLLAGHEEEARGEVPESVQRYRAFIREKRGMRETSRGGGEFADPRLAAWRRRQINRCIGELGPVRATAIIHAPMAIELSKGCTVGCWFCGVAAPKFEHTWPHDEANGRLWREALAGLRGILGDSIKHGFLYWATDPLDNPDYEDFLTDFHATLGRCPQTTTAQGHKDPARSRRLLQLSHAMGSEVDRFSIVTLKAMRRVHQELTPEELLRVELVPQNKEASETHPKANAGRALRFSEKKAKELVAPEMTSTIACVSGFLLNMVEGSVKLITPCDSSERWPLGYWIVDERHFTTADELCDGVRAMIDEHARDRIGPDDLVRLRRDVRVAEEDDGTVALTCFGLETRFADQPAAEHLVELLRSGDLTVGAFAATREREAGVSYLETMAVIDQLFSRGLLDEEPTPPEPPVQQARPERSESLTQAS